ncbi:MAG: STAS domain-containing protein [Pseudomonadota bacterium]
MLGLEIVGGRQVLKVEVDKLDSAAAPRFKAAFREKVGSAAEDVLLDLGRVSFVDSAGIGVLVGCLKLLEPPRQLVLVNVSPTVRRVLSLTRMDRVFRIEDSAVA